MNLYLILFMFGIMIGIFIGVQDISVTVYKAILEALSKHKVKKKNRGMF